MSVLRGDRKQSVRDAELMFNPNLLKWLGYTAESEYVGRLFWDGIVQMMIEDLVKRNVQALINSSCNTL